MHQITSLVDLPYGLAIHGQPALNHTAACIRARDFAQSLRDPVVLYLDVDDQNNAFFNQSTGASTPDYSLTYDAHASPPGLVVMRSVGDGIRVGGGFLLTLCCVGIVLSAGMLALRVWDDMTWAKRATLSAEGEGNNARHARQFSPLGADDADDADDSSSYRLATSPPPHTHSVNRGRSSQSRSSHVALAHPGDFHGDIELEEQRQRRERGDDSSDHDQLERKQDDGDSDGALEPERPSPSSVNQAAFEPRSHVPRLAPPPTTSSGAADVADIDIELASFEEEMLRHQHELETAQQAHATQDA